MSPARTGSGGPLLPNTNDPPQDSMMIKSRAPVKVAFCVDNLDVGGTELNAIRTAERIDRTRFQLHLVCLRPAAGALLERYEALNIPVTAFPVGSLASAQMFSAGIHLMRFLRSENIHILHAHDLYSNIFGGFWAKRARSPRIILSRRWWDGPYSSVHSLMNRLSYGFADSVLANSPSIGRLLVSKEGVPISRITVVPNFLDDRAFEKLTVRQTEQLRNELGLRGEGPVIGCIANLNTIKGHAALIRAVSRLRESVPSIVLVLVGVGPLGGTLRELARSLGMEANVRFAGSRPSFPNLHHLFDISALTSLNEGLPNSLLEAMAAGRPVVATNVGAISDAVVDGNTGLLVPADDVGAIHNALQRLVSDRELASIYGMNGRRRAAAKFSASVALGCLEDLYESLAPQTL